ncbi:MAG: lysozyme [Robiginitomaculum sp.]
MSNDFTISPLGMKLIKAFEGYRENAATLATGQRVVGYGHPLEDGESHEALSRDAAENLLREDLAPIEKLISETVFAPLTQSQFDAVCSLVLNIGPTNFRQSNLRHALNNGRVLDAASAFDEWRKAEIAGKAYVVDALVRRRTAEKALFLRPEKGDIRASNGGLEIQSDQSYLRVSDDETFDPDVGIVNVSGEAIMSVDDEIPQRRADDGVAGVLTLTERAPKTVHDPVTGGQVIGQQGSANALANQLDILEDKDYHLDIPNPNAPVSTPAGPSPIAIAAAEVSDRLDALIDTARTDGEKVVMPEEGESLALENDVPLAANSNDGGRRKTKAVAATRGADAYIQRGTGSKSAAANRKKSAGGIYGLFMFLGGCLSIGGLTSWLTGMTRLGDIGRFLAPWAMIFGALMFIGGLYYGLRTFFRAQKA